MSQMPHENYRAARRRFCLVTTSALIVQFFLIPHLRRLSERFEVTLVANEDCAPLLAREHVLGVRTVNIPIRREIAPLNDLVSLARMVRLFRRERFDAVVTVAPKTGLIGMIAAALASTPVRCHVFQGEVWATRHGLFRWGMKLLDRLVATLATDILVVSKSERDFLAQQGVVEGGRATVLGAGSICGVSTKRFQPNQEARKKARSKLGVSEQALVVLYLGRIKKDKGVLDLVRAWSDLATQYPELHLVMVGPDEDGLAPQLRQIPSPQVATRLYLRGQTEEPETWIAAADMLSLPSYREGFGMVLIEASAMGLPVVASRIYGVSDAMIEGVTGLAHPPGDVAALRAALERLIRDPELRRKFGQAGRIRVLEEFEQEEVVGRYIEFWDSMIRKAAEHGRARSGARGIPARAALASQRASGIDRSTPCEIYPSPAGLMREHVMERLSCFTAYDVRGKLGAELNEGIAYRIGRAYAQYLNARRVVVGGDVRNTSEPLKQALAKGLMDAGADVVDIGMTGTEEIYFAAFYLDVDGGIEVTASHNPLDYNGMKFVGRGAAPISGDSGLRSIQRLAETGDFRVPARPGGIARLSVLQPYVAHLLRYIDVRKLKPLTLVVNAGNGAAGHVVDAIEHALAESDVPVRFVKIHHRPDGNFPNGIPNPLLPENRATTAAAVREHRADMGVAWDGDFDRCFLFDERGEFIEGYYLVGLLAEAFLKKNAGEKIIHDPRLTWNTKEMVLKAGGTPIQSKTGHAFIKERMRLENAIYGGEMSAHHYFRDFAYCDSGMIPWLLVAELLSVSGKPLSALVAERVAAYPCSGEINYRVTDARACMQRVRDHFAPSCIRQDEMDGISMEFASWRFNLRMSNTEPLLRLNVEARGDVALVKRQVEEIAALIRAQ